MKQTLFIIALFISSISNAQQIKVYYEHIEGSGYKIVADNAELCPVTVKINFNLSNLRITSGNNTVFVVPPKSKKILLTELVKIKTNKRYKMSFNTLFNYGNHNLKTYDKNYEYYLPFSTGVAFKIHQGYNGSFSHQNENSLDFSMPVGTDLFAARDGIVIKVIDKNNKHCGKKECMKYNNLIMIYHSDGTFAEYLHIKKGGAKVKVGDLIKKGQLIAQSGNVGFSTGPHLHFVTFIQLMGNRKTIKTKFLIEDGSEKVFLNEKETYKRMY